MVSFVVVAVHKVLPDINKEPKTLGNVVFAITKKLSEGSTVISDTAPTTPPEMSDVDQKRALSAKPNDVDSRFKKSGDAAFKVEFTANPTLLPINQGSEKVAIKSTLGPTELKKREIGMVAVARSGSNLMEPLNETRTSVPSSTMWAVTTPIADWVSKRAGKIRNAFFWRWHRPINDIFFMLYFLGFHPGLHGLNKGGYHHIGRFFA